MANSDLPQTFARNNITTTQKAKQRRSKERNPAQTVEGVGDTFINTLLRLESADLQVVEEK